jgi:hypothetical protein
MHFRVGPNTLTLDQDSISIEDSARILTVGLDDGDRAQLARALDPEAATEHDVWGASLRERVAEVERLQAAAVAAQQQLDAYAAADADMAEMVRAAHDERDEARAALTAAEERAMASYADYLNEANRAMGLSAEIESLRKAAPSPEAAPAQTLSERTREVQEDAAWARWNATVKAHGSEAAPEPAHVWVMSGNLHRCTACGIYWGPTADDFPCKGEPAAPPPPDVGEPHSPERRAWVDGVMTAATRRLEKGAEPLHLLHEDGRTACGVSHGAKVTFRAERVTCPACTPEPAAPPQGGPASYALRSLWALQGLLPMTGRVRQCVAAIESALRAAPAAPHGGPARFKVDREGYVGPSASSHEPGLWTIFVHVQGRTGDTGLGLADELQAVIDRAPHGGARWTIHAWEGHGDGWPYRVLGLDRGEVVRDQVAADYGDVEALVRGTLGVPHGGDAESDPFTAAARDIVRRWKAGEMEHASAFNEIVRAFDGLPSPPAPLEGLRARLRPTQAPHEGEDRAKPPTGCRVEPANPTGRYQGKWWAFALRLSYGQSGHDSEAEAIAALWVDYDAGHVHRCAPSEARAREAGEALERWQGWALLHVTPGPAGASDADMRLCLSRALRAYRASRAAPSPKATEPQPSTLQGPYGGPHLALGPNDGGSLMHGHDEPDEEPSMDIAAEARGLVMNTCTAHNDPERDVAQAECSICVADALARLRSPTSEPVKRAVERIMSMTPGDDDGGPDAT